MNNKQTCTWMMIALLGASSALASNITATQSIDTNPPVAPTNPPVAAPSGQPTGAAYSDPYANPYGFDAPVSMPIPGYGTPGYGSPGMDPILQWCDNSLYILRLAKNQASGLQYAGQHTQARRVLIQGLNQAIQNGMPYGMMSPLTQLAIQRSIQLEQMITAKIGSDPRAIRTVVYLLMDAYDFIEDVAYETDVNYYIPYQSGNCRTCGVDSSAFELAMVKFAGEEVNLVLRSLAQVSGNRVFPIGSPAAFLNGLEFMVAAARMDLSSSIFGSYYACEIQELGSLGYQLSAFNSGQGYSFPNAYVAVQSTYFQASDIVARIVGAQRCNGRRY